MLVIIHCVQTYHILPCCSSYSHPCIWHIDLVYYCTFGSSLQCTLQNKDTSYHKCFSTNVWHVCNRKLHLKASCRYKYLWWPLDTYQWALLHTNAQNLKIGFWVIMHIFNELRRWSWELLKVFLAPIDVLKVKSVIKIIFDLSLTQSLLNECN